MMYIVWAVPPRLCKYFSCRHLYIPERQTPQSTLGLPKLDQREFPRAAMAQGDGLIHCADESDLARITLVAPLVLNCWWY